MSNVNLDEKFNVTSDHSLRRGALIFRTIIILLPKAVGQYIA